LVADNRLAPNNARKMGSVFGTLFRVATWGESHGVSVGGLVDGCPPRIPITIEEIQKELDRRRPGQSDIVTPRDEADKVELLSGLYNGMTLGTPIAFEVRNRDQRPSAYDNQKDVFRPSHADFTYNAKYGIRAVEGGGRASARETLARVAAGAIARKVLAIAANVRIVAYVERVQDIAMPELARAPTLAEVEASPVRCPHPETAALMEGRIRAVRAQGDSVGGIVRCHVENVPAGLGEPVFDRLEADLARAMLSIPATKGFEFGSGFAGTLLTGSQHNDVFIKKDGAIHTATNRSGGIQGGISNGEEIVFRVAFKPTATILRPQETVDKEGNPAEILAKGRHDPCVLPRAVPIVEAMAALVLADHYLRNAAQNFSVRL
jgi:chorismate synthase